MKNANLLERICQCLPGAVSTVMKADGQMAQLSPMWICFDFLFCTHFPQQPHSHLLVLSHGQRARVPSR